jgi:hypothetical protein
MQCNNPVSKVPVFVKFSIFGGRFRITENKTSKHSFQWFNLLIQENIPIKGGREKKTFGMAMQMNA